MGKKNVSLTFANPFTLIVQQAPSQPSLAGGWLQTTINGVTVKGQNMSFTLADDMQLRLQVVYTDAKGHPAPVDGAVQWATSDETIATVTPDDTDSTFAMLTPATNLGNVQVTATADADLGPGVSTLITQGACTIVAGQAVAGNMQPVGDPTPIPPPAKK